MPSFLSPEVILRYSCLITISRSNIVGRHYFYAFFIKPILNILVQIRINLCQLIGIFNICIHLIDGIIILKRCFQYKRTRVIHYSGSIQRRFNQKLMGLSPWNMAKDPSASD